MALFIGVAHFQTYTHFIVVTSCVDSEYASERVEKVEKKYQPTTTSPLPQLVASGDISQAFLSVLYTGSNMEGDWGLGTRLEKW